MSDLVVTQWGKARAVAGFRAFSFLGSEFTVFALVLRERGQGATFISLLLAAGTISLVTMVSLAGWIVDRFTTKQIIPLTSITQALLISSLIFQHNSASILITLFLSSSCGAIENPAFMALLPTLVAKDDLAKQVGFAQSLYALAGLAAPAFGGILISFSGYKTPLIIDAMTFLLLAISPSLLNVNRRSEAAGRGEKIRASDGLKFIFSNRHLRALAILICAFLFAAGTVSVANVFLLTKVLHASVSVFGVVGAVSALGMIVGGVVLMQVRIAQELQSKTIAAALALASGLIVGVSFAGHWLIVCVLEFFIGLLTAVVTALLGTIFIQSSPSEMRGRIGAALNGFMNIGMIASLLASGPLLDWLGVRRLLFLAGALAIVLVGILSPATFKEAAKGTSS
jgi:MFS family permease